MASDATRPLRRAGARFHQGYGRQTATWQDAGRCPTARVRCCNMANNSEPHDGGAWGDYVKGGRGHFERVVRSFNVFGRNTQELFALLRAAETDFLSSMRLMEITGFEAEDGARFREEFWGELDQRLHNMVSSAVAVVDHTRPLLAFYEHEPEFVAEWGERSEEVAKSPRALFLRRLRNYLLHYGVAPLMQSMVLGPPKEAKDWDDLTIRLSPDGLLRYSGWNGSNREYIHSFEGGPPLRQITQEYGEDMTTLYNWLFSQYPVLHVPGVPPPHLYL